MGYRNTYFRIESRYQPYGGWENENDETAFREETRQILKAKGWNVYPNEIAGCDSATKGLQDLYLHPQSFSGIIAEDEMAALQDAFSRAQTFECYHVDVYEEYVELSDDEYRTRLETQKKEIESLVLEMCTTKRKNLYKTGSVAMAVANRFAIRRISDKDGNNGLGISYVHDIIMQLLADGRLMAAETKHGLGLRTVTEKERSGHKQEEVNEQQMTLFG